MPSPSPQVVRTVLVTTVITGLLALAFIPTSGRPAFIAQLAEFKNRQLGERYTAEETAELDFLNCVEAGLEVVPAGSSLHIQTEDGYLIQRIADISYPRLNLVVAEGEYAVFVDEDASESLNVISSFQCGAHEFKVVSYE